MHSLFFLATTLASFISITWSQTIDPNSVPIATRQFWCTSQITQCPLICLQTAGNSAGTYANDCDAASLSYDCICSNGMSPNASEYSQTIPYFICTEYNTQCQAACGNDNTCAAACVQKHPCGAQNPTRVNTSTISTMSATGTSGGAAASTQSDGAVYTGFGNSAETSAASSSSGGDSSAASRLFINMGQIYGLGVVAAGVFAGFTLLL